MQLYVFKTRPVLPILLSCVFVYARTEENSGFMDMDVSLGIPFQRITTPSALAELAMYEEYIFDKMLDVLETEISIFINTEDKSQISIYLEEMLDDFEAASSVSSMHGATVVSQNPILAFKLIYRFSKVLPGIAHRLQKLLPLISVKSQESLNFLYSTEHAKWPTKEALDDAIVRILRIQLEYDLDVRDIVTGQLLGIKTLAKLSAHHVLEIVEYATPKGLYTLILPWLEFLLEELEDNIEIEISKEELENRILSLKKNHDMYWPDRNNRRSVFYTQRILGGLNETTKRTKLTPFRKIKKCWANHFLNPIDMESNFWSLCSGENHQSEAEKSKLKCWYKSRPNTYFAVNPIKMELLSTAPFLVQAYDVIGENTIREFEEHVEENFYITVEPSQTSVEVLLRADPSKVVRIMDAITSLNTAPGVAAEDILVISYAFGGHFECHLDAFVAHNRKIYGEAGARGNRIATLIFYLSDVEAGGLTVFPLAGVSVRPIKGSAIFFYNLKRNGKVDANTHHCGCPVVLGGKTIATKWIREYEQFLRRPCSLKEDD